MSIQHHHHVAVTPSVNKAFGFGIALNLIFVAIEALYGWQSGSLALLADAGHNLSDVAGLILAWIATLANTLKPDKRHTYGWQRASVLAAFFNALILLVAMGALCWEAIGRFHTPTAVEGQTIMIVAGIGIVINTATALLFLQGQSNDINIRGAFLHMTADAAVSAGVVIAGGLYMAFGWIWIDPATSIAIAAVVVATTWGLFRESLNLLFDGVPRQINPEAVHAWLSSRPGVVEVHDLHIWAMSTTEVALTAHMVMPKGHPGDAFLRTTTTSLRKKFGIAHPTLQIETDPMSKICAHRHR